MGRTSSLVVAPLTTSTAWWDFFPRENLKLSQLLPGGNSSGLGGCPVQRRTTKEDLVCGFWTRRRGLFWIHIHSRSLLDLAFVQVSGFAGAGHVSVELEKMLQQREERLDFLLDEGMFVMQVKVTLSLLTTCSVMQGVVPGINDPVIYIGNILSLLT